MEKIKLIILSRNKFRTFLKKKKKRSFLAQNATERLGKVIFLPLLSQRMPEHEYFKSEFNIFIAQIRSSIIKAFIFKILCL